MSAWLERLQAGLRQHEVTREDTSQPGQSQERFTIVREIGRGGMGTVFEAQDNELQRRVALKFLHGRSLIGLERFQVESRTLARLQHPNVVAVHEVGEVEGGVFLVMDFVDGESLDHRVRRGPLEPREAARIAREVALGLEHCHAHDVLHRDVKPGNVLLAEDGRVLLTDFGVAKELDESRGLTKTGAMVGTPAYMPPEQALGERRAVDARSDVFALGATLYELLTGDPPQAELTLPLRLVEGDPDPPSSKRPGIDADLDALCLRCLRSEPGRRYPSARALSEDLERYLRGEPVLARQNGRRGQAALLVGLTLVVGVLGVVIGVLLLERRPSPSMGASPRASGAIASPTATPGPSFAPLAKDPLRLELPEIEGGGFAGPEQAFAWSGKEWRVWRLSDQRLIAQDRPSDPINHVAASRDGRRLVVSRVGRVQVFALPSGQVLKEIPLRPGLVAAPPSSGEVAFLVRRALFRWGEGAPQRVAECGSEPRSLLYSPDGALLVLGAGQTHNQADSRRELVIWETETGAQKQRWKLTRPALCLAFSADSRLLAVGDDWGAVRVFDVERPQAPPLDLSDKSASLVLSLGGAHAGEISGLAFGEGGVLYTTSGNPPARAKTLPNEVRRWQVTLGQGSEPGRAEALGILTELGDEVLTFERGPGRGLLLRSMKAAQGLVVQKEPRP